jgi:NitT/TauT family transport system ATP-binding protein
MLAQPQRVGVAPEIIQRTLAGRLKISPDGTMRESSRYLLLGRDGAERPDPRQAAWLYAQMVRWGQASLGTDALAAAKAVFRPDLYDAALGTKTSASETGSDPVGAFAGPAFDGNDVSTYLAAFKIGRRSV